MTATLEVWALPRLEQLLPLDRDSLKQIIIYTDTLPKTQAAEHLKDILGDSAQALEFISSFNQRRQRPPEEARPATNVSEVPKARSKHTKKKTNIHELPARRVDGYADSDRAYRKHDEEDYMPKRQRHKEQVAESLSLTTDRPDATQLPLITNDASLTSKPVTSKLPPSAAGQLVGELSKKPTSRTASPAAKTKVNIAGGTAMHGASTALSDLDSAIRALEIQTNPALVDDSADDSKRQCNCMATRHPLLDIAPNCIHCGKVICVKQGLGPCTFCHKPIISNDEISKVLRVLKDERGEERMRVNNAAHKKADVSVGKARAFTGREFLAQASARSSPMSSAPASDGEEDEASSKAKAHRDKLLNFQANNARRTQIHDEAADYDMPSAGTNMWASPQERAQQLKKQQRIMREMEWNARPEYEKRQVVASIDIKSGKIVKRMANVEKPDFTAEEPGDDYIPPAPQDSGTFSHNPLMGSMIRPTARIPKGKDPEREKKSTWRRVQMDEDDNEQWILDGGLYGGQVDGRVLGAEEHAQG